jgi:pyridinium-3,5-biscarboxylic acid mononucleotide synthase
VPDGKGERPAATDFVDLGFARVDVGRLTRTGDPEVVYASGKAPSATVEIVSVLHTAAPQRAVLITRASDAHVEALRNRWPDAIVDQTTVAVGPMPQTRGRVVIVSGGTSDGHVVAEASMTVAAFGSAPEVIEDVGVAGLHRVLAVRDCLDAADVVVVIAGMEGALPSVIGGLVGTPVVAVPTSVGYGANFSGLSALLGMLNSCAPGVVVCNIDNGFGAGVFAARVARRCVAGRHDWEHP